MASIFTTDQPTKAAIMNTFLQLYATKPLGQITVKEISRPTSFANYGDNATAQRTNRPTARNRPCFFYFKNCVVPQQILQKHKIKTDAKDAPV